MYAGKIVEEGASSELLRRPCHPYTRGLLRSLPCLGDRRERLYAIRGNVPNPLNYPAGCRFNPRCDMSQAVCREVEPPLRGIAPGRTSACHFAEVLLEEE